MLVINSRVGDGLVFELLRDVMCYREIVVRVRYVIEKVSNLFFLWLDLFNYYWIVWMVREVIINVRLKLNGLLVS